MSADKLVLTAGVGHALYGEDGYKVPMESERGYHLELTSPQRYPVNPMMVASGKFADLDERPYPVQVWLSLAVRRQVLRKG